MFFTFCVDFWFYCFSLLIEVSKSILGISWKFELFNLHHNSFNCRLFIRGVNSLCILLFIYCLAMRLHNHPKRAVLNVDQVVSRPPKDCGAYNISRFWFTGGQKHIFSLELCIFNMWFCRQIKLFASNTRDNPRKQVLNFLKHRFKNRQIVSNIFGLSSPMQILLGFF